MKFDAIEVRPMGAVGLLRRLGGTTEGDLGELRR